MTRRVSEGVTVALPVGPGRPPLEDALASILGQTHEPLEILLLLNGASERSARLARDAAASDERVHMVELAAPSLPAALNAALREASHELVARMDADDLCAPERIARQAAHMAAHPGTAVLGTAFETRDFTGRLLSVTRPPTTSEEIRWRLLLGNQLAHGSVMLRRAAVTAAGGYDERLLRGQDYDLWLRMSAAHALENLPDVLMTRRVTSAEEERRADDAQAASAGAALAGAWASLAHEAGADDVAEAVALALADESNAQIAQDALAARLRESPSGAALIGWLWARNRASAHVDADAWEVCRAARVREVVSMMQSEGAGRVWLWGAGAHTRRLLEERGDLDLEVEGLLDDARAGERAFGFEVLPPLHAPAGAHVLISSDAHEESMWERRGEFNARGVRVWRLYGANEREGVAACARV